MSSSRWPEPLSIEEGEESVWDYPRPPALESFEGNRLEIIHRGELIASTERGYRVLETSHPPVYYFPPDDCNEGLIQPSRDASQSYCEWKGEASYLDVVMPAHDLILRRVAWRYMNPTERFAPIAGYIAFYAAPFDECLVRGERARPQPGGFYGGWITDDIKGPFKGEPGSWGW